MILLQLPAVICQRTKSERAASLTRVSPRHPWAARACDAQIGVQKTRRLKTVRPRGWRVGFVGTVSAVAALEWQPFECVPKPPDDSWEGVEKYSSAGVSRLQAASGKKIPLEGNGPMRRRRCLRIMSWRGGRRQRTSPVPPRSPSNHAYIGIPHSRAYPYEPPHPPTPTRVWCLSTFSAWWAAQPP